MKTRKHKAMAALAGVSLLFLCLISAPLQGNDADLQDLVRQLGANEFSERQQAESQLKALSRDTLGGLRSLLSTTDDPEIRIRLERIVEHLINDTSKIPQVYRALKITERGAFAPLAEEFRGRASMGAHNTRGSSGTGGAFAQSFIPKTNTISSIEVCTYALGGNSGWMRLDLCADKTGAPGPVLARSWMRIPINHNFPHGNYVYHDIPDQSVKPNATYWLVYFDFPDDASKDNMINYGLSFQRDDYPDGMLWRSHGEKPLHDQDVKFRIFSSNPESHPAYRKATELEVKTISPEQEKKSWNKRKTF